MSLKKWHTWPLLCSVACLSPSTASALAVIVVTPSAIEQSREKSPVPVTVIDQQEIERSNARNISELLRSQAGLQISDYYGDGSTATVDLRGFGPSAGSNTLILLDGRRLNHFSDLGNADLSQVDLDSVERIEILQGSGGVLYGNQAVGGVVNIIRKKQVEPGSDFEIGLGSYGAHRLTAGIDRYLGSMFMELNIADEHSDNYRDNNDRDRQNLALRLSKQHATFSSFVELNSSRSELEAPGALLEAEVDDDRKQSLSDYEDDYFDTDTDVLRAGVDKTLSDNSTIQFDIAREKTDREFLNTFRGSTGSETTQERVTDSITVRYANPFQVSGIQGHLVSGLEWHQTDYELDSSLGQQEMDQDIAELFVATDWVVSDNGQFQFGARASRQEAKITDEYYAIDNESFDDSVSVVSIGYSHRFSNVKLFIRADQNYRYPTVEEHTNVPFGEESGLKTQQGVSYEMGAEWQMDQNLVRSTLYQIDLDDEIGFDSSGFANLNLDQTRRQGILFEVINTWSNNLSTQISLTLLDAEITDGAFKGNNLPLVAERQLRLSADYRFSEQYSQRVEVIATGEQVFGGDFGNDLDKMQAYEIVNWVFNIEQKDYRIALRVNNLLDEDYSQPGTKYSDYSAWPTVTDYQAFFPAPERNVWMTLSWSL